MKREEKQRLLEVEGALFHKMLGYDYEEEKIIEEKEGEKVIKVKCERIRKHIPADSGMLLEWLKNRYPERWSKTHSQEDSSFGVVILPQIKEDE